MPDKNQVIYFQECLTWQVLILGPRNKRQYNDYPLVSRVPGAPSDIKIHGCSSLLKKWPGTMNIMGCICGLCLWDLTNHRCGTWKPGGMSILPYICIVLCSLKNASHSLSPYKFATAKSLQSCPILCDPRDGSPPGSPVPGILQQEHWSGLPFPSPMQESEKCKWSYSVVSDSQPL